MGQKELKEFKKPSPEVFTKLVICSMDNVKKVMKKGRSVEEVNALEKGLKWNERMIYDFNKGKKKKGIECWINTYRNGHWTRIKVKN